MSPIDAAIKDLETIGDCRTCGNINPFCDSNPDSCGGYKWRGVPFASSDDNPPLTLEELREMDGEPVWLHTFSAVQKKTQVACWAILECCSSTNAVFLRAGVNSRLTKWFCNYGERWLAYRRKPKEWANASI